MTDVLKYRFCQISGFSKCDIGLFSHLVWFLMGPWRPKLTNLSAVFCKKYKFKVNMHPEVIKIKSPPGTPWLQGKVTEFTWMGGSILLCGIWGSIKVGANPGSRQGKIAKTIRAVHILRQPPEGGGGVSKILTISDKGVCGSEKFSTKGFYVNKNVDR